MEKYWVKLIDLVAVADLDLPLYCATVFKKSGWDVELSEDLKKNVEFLEDILNKRFPVSEEKSAPDYGLQLPVIQRLMYVSRESLDMLLTEDQMILVHDLLPSYHEKRIYSPKIRILAPKSKEYAEKEISDLGIGFQYLGDKFSEGYNFSAFIVSDKKGYLYREEFLDKDFARGVANFNNPRKAEILNSVFEKLWGPKVKDHSHKKSIFERIKNAF